MKKPDYLEIEFAMPFYELYYPDLYNDNKLQKNPFELEELCQKLNTKIDFELLYKTYETTKDEEGEIMVYHSFETEERFIYIDLLKDKYDQMNMVTIAVRIKYSEKKSIKETLEKLYFKSTTRSDWQEDYFNQSLWQKVKGINREYKQNITQVISTVYKDSIRLKKHFREGVEITKNSIK